MLAAIADAFVIGMAIILIVPLFLGTDGTISMMNEVQDTVLSSVLAVLDGRRTPRDIFVGAIPPAVLQRQRGAVG